MTKTKVLFQIIDMRVSQNEVPSLFCYNIFSLYLQCMEIREGRIEDAPFIAEVVMGAMGDKLCVGLADSPGRLPLVQRLFIALAEDSFSQYSHKNALIAVNSEGEQIGAIIAYDGANLHHLRRAFIREANIILGWNVSEEDAAKWGDETDESEIYIDSLYVVKKWRKQGVASGLLNRVNTKFQGAGKPLGLLVEPENKKARTTYEHWGFKEVGISNFFATPMIHMQLPSKGNY